MITNLYESDLIREEKPYTTETIIGTAVGIVLCMITIVVIYYAKRHHLRHKQDNQIEMTIENPQNNRKNPYDIVPPEQTGIIGYDVVPPEQNPLGYDIVPEEQGNAGYEPVPVHRHPGDNHDDYQPAPEAPAILPSNQGSVSAVQRNQYTPAPCKANPAQYDGPPLYQAQVANNGYEATPAQKAILGDANARPSYHEVKIGTHGGLKWMGVEKNTNLYDRVSQQEPQPRYDQVDSPGL
jgi:hypothetical protein